MMGSDSLAVPSWESEGNPDRPPQGKGDVHRRGGTCSCRDQGPQLRGTALVTRHPEPCQCLRPCRELIWGQENRHGGWTEVAAALAL